LWQFGDGTSSSQTNPTHTCAALGAYTVTLKVSGRGETDTLTRPSYVTVVTNSPPHRPSNPTPSDGATGQSVNVDLSWTGGDPDGDAVTYDIYLEVNDDTPGVRVSLGQSGTTFDPGTLSANAHYYWQPDGLRRADHQAILWRV
jgi:PKD repeat protein